MTEWWHLTVAFGAGLLLGTLFFGGLWWTVRKGVLAKRPALWFLGSWLLRTGVVLVGFYLISGGRWERLLACLFGFVSARFIVILLVRSMCPPTPGRRAGAATEHQINPEREASHAP